MSVSILTYWGVPNYGAYAQAYALNAILRQLGHKTEHISYLHPSHYKLYFTPPSLLSGLKFWRPRGVWHCIKHYRTIKAFNRKFTIDQKYIPHTPRMSGAQLSQHNFDCVVTGSDAIWEFSIPEFGDDAFLIGNNLNCSRLVSYATSFGMMAPKDAFPAFVTAGLKKYHSIAVRDDNSANIVEKLIGIRPPIVIDPTLLWDFPSDPIIPKTDKRDYILVYSTGFDDQTVRQLKEYASSNDLELIGAGLSHSWCDCNIALLSPIEWISLFSNAACVATSTFHGFMFALNYKRPLLFRMVPYVKNRCSWLLKQLNLYDHFQCDSTPVKDLMSHKLDYTAISTKLSELRKFSIQYLQSAVLDKQYGS